MAFTHPILDILFLATVAVIWSMIFYQLLFTFLGYTHRIRSVREQREMEAWSREALPGVSVLVPAHNEELVIESTLRSLLRLDYPKDRIEIIVVNDGSTDATEKIVLRIAEKDSRVVLLNVPEGESAQGKAHALNLGVKTARFPVLAVYDADNTPEPPSLRYLVTALLKDPTLAAAFGKFRTRNRKRNLLTRFINLETLSFQFMVQAGRYALLRVAILPGTNLVIWKDRFDGVGGWDERALTEDTELSIRLYAAGHHIKFVPYAVTWEEEPEQWRVWLRQRTRWVRGNFYVLRKHFLGSLRAGHLGITLELFNLFLLYYFFIAAILLSHVFFVLGAAGLVGILAPGPYFAVWLSAFVLFIAELCLAATFEEEKIGETFGVAVLMYFIYCQAWLVIVFRAVWQEYAQRGRFHWEKTRRFASGTQVRSGESE